MLPLIGVTGAVKQTTMLYKHHGHVHILTPLIYPVRPFPYKTCSPSCILRPASLIPLLPPPSRDYPSFLPSTLQCNSPFAETPPPMLPDPHYSPRLRVPLVATTRLALQGHGWSLATTPTRPPHPKGVLKGRRPSHSVANHAKDARELRPSW